MRIVHAIRSDGFAGVETHVARLAAAQHDRGHTVTVIGGDPTSMRSTTSRDAVDLVPARTVVDVAKELRRRTFARTRMIVHTHMTAAELAAALAVPAGGPRIVTTRHFAAVRGSSLLGRASAVAITRRLSAQISVSHHIADHIDGRSATVHPGVATAADSLAAPDREQTVLLVQRLAPEKETDLAIRAFARSGLGDRGWRLEIAGDGPQRRELEGLVARLGITTVTTFLGRLTGVAERMGRAGILLAPCSTEGLGMTVLEAMAAGIPIIAAASGGHLETVGRVDGAALHQPGDVDDAASVLVGLAQNPLRRTMYGAALQADQRERFTLAAQAAATDSVYESVL